MQPNSLTDKAVAAWKALLDAHALTSGAIEALLRERQKIPLTWFDVLWLLRKSPARRLRFRSLQAEIFLSRSALSRSVDALARAGLVHKEPCPDDQRGVDVVLTESGNRALATAWPVYAEGIQRFFASRLTEEDCFRLREILQKV